MTTPTERIARLTDLRDHIAMVPLAEFDMAAFFTRTACGTACCVAGHAAARPMFQAAGGVVDPHVEAPDRQGRCLDAAARFPGAMGGSFSGFGSAVGAYLGLDRNEIEDLFYAWPSCEDCEALEVERGECDHLSGAEETRAAKVAEIDALIAATVTT